MGRAKGHVISGKVGSMIGRNVDGEQIWTALSRPPKQTLATKKSAALFGINSRLASYIRGTVCCNSAADKTMVSRFTSATYAIVRHCHDKERNSFNFTKNSFDRLNGFEFNIKSPLADSLWAKPNLNIESKKLIITIPQLKVTKDLKFPAKAVSCLPLLDVFLYTPAEGQYLYNSFQMEEISNVKKTIPDQVFKIDIPEGCIALIGLSLFFYSTEYTVKKTMNSRDFSPAGICGVIINPGTCNPDELLAEWHPDSKIKLNNVTFNEPKDIEETDETITGPRSPQIIDGRLRRVKKASMQNVSANKEPNPLLAVARNLRDMGLGDEDIAKATGLSMEELAGLD